MRLSDCAIFFVSRFRSGVAVCGPLKGFVVVLVPEFVAPVVDLSYNKDRFTNESDSHPAQISVDRLADRAWLD